MNQLQKLQFRTQKPLTSYVPYRSNGQGGRRPLQTQRNMLIGSELYADHSQMVQTLNKEPLVLPITNRTNLMSPTSNQFATSDTARARDHMKQ